MEVLITQIGAIIVALIASYQAIRLERLRKESKRKDIQIRESSKNFSALSLLIDFELIGLISNRVDEIFENSCIDRFLLIIAVNGRDVFNVVSVVYERHKSISGEPARRIDINAVGRYTHVGIDSAYKQMLTDVEKRGKVLIETEFLSEDSLLYSIYKNEGVTSSLVCPVIRMALDDTNDMLLFCSYATHVDSGIPKKDVSFVRTMHGGIQSAFSKYVDKIELFTKTKNDE